ncbi:hypothetical protein ABW19_dt0205286 [Dactylella cylindrospora]|nr:hypothetical protein ABW19_dt0205286 [Dactylella cylindrospora]
MRITRVVLRNSLIESVPKDVTIKWGTICTSAAKLDTGKIAVQPSDGKMDECDLLVACDGSRSKIRHSLRPDDAKLTFQNVTMIMGKAVYDGVVPPPADVDFGMYLSGTGIGLFVAANDEHSMVWCLSYHSPEPRDIPKYPMSQEQLDSLIEETLERGRDILEPFSSYVKATDFDSLTILNVQDRAPFPHLEGSLADMPVVFLGDANHAVSPFAGNGASMALSDAWDFAEQLCKFPSLEQSIKAFDAMMLPRSKVDSENEPLEYILCASDWVENSVLDLVF